MDMEKGFPELALQLLTVREHKAQYLFLKLTSIHNTIAAYLGKTDFESVRSMSVGR